MGSVRLGHGSYDVVAARYAAEVAGTGKPIHLDQAPDVDVEHPSRRCDVMVSRRSRW